MLVDRKQTRKNFRLSLNTHTRVHYYYYYCYSMLSLTTREYIYETRSECVRGVVIIMISLVITTQWRRGNPTKSWEEIALRGHNCVKHARKNVFRIIYKNCDGTFKNESRHVFSYTTIGRRETDTADMW